MNDDPRTRRRFIIGAGIATTIGLAGCTDSPSSEPDEGSNDENTSEDNHSTHAEGHDASLDGPNASATVTMVTGDNGTHFEPHGVWVEQGGTVTWELQSGSHTVTAYASENDAPQRIPDSAEAWDSGTIGKEGETFEHTFETTGVYDYYCTPHEGTGMIGSVIVGEPDTQGQPGLQSPQEDLPDEAQQKIEMLNQTVTEALSGSSGSNGGEESGHNDSHSGH